MDIKKFEFANNFDPHVKNVMDDPSAVYEKAFNDAKRGLEAELLQEMSDLSLKVEKLLNRQDEIMGSLVNDTARLTYAIVSKIFENYSHNGGHIDEICALIKESIVARDDELKLSINISPKLIDQVKNKLSSELSPHMMDRLVFDVDDNFDEASCRIEWFDGGVERSLDDILSNIQTVLDKINKNQDLNIKEIKAAIDNKGKDKENINNNSNNNKENLDQDNN